jgi:hypothetical protein
MSLFVERPPGSVELDEEGARLRIIGRRDRARRVREEIEAEQLTA